MAGNLSRVLLAAAAVAMLGAQPAAAQDLIYRYKPSEISPLKRYNQQPYWRMLSECAGVYGGLVNHYQTTGAGSIEGAKAEGVRFLNAATSRLRQDRGLSQQAALDLTRDAVEAGRMSAAGMLASPPPRDRTHEQLIDVFCTQIMDAHQSALRFARR